jgi:hypothetical protein
VRALLLLAPLLVSATPPAQHCPKPIAVPQAVATANPSSTLYTDVEPPARFAHVPRKQLRISFGKEAIDAMCGRPPCGMIFEGCTDGEVMALPDPFTTDPQTFARIVRHELGHVAGWPGTHGA